MQPRQIVTTQEVVESARELREQAREVVETARRCHARAVEVLMNRAQEVRRAPGQPPLLSTAA